MADRQMPPRSSSTPASVGDLVWLFISLRGRISREPYWLGFGVIFCLLAALAGLWLQVAAIDIGPNGDLVLQESEQGVLLQVIMLALQWAIIALVAKRCHDRGLSGFLSFLTLVPIVSIPFVIFIGLPAGDPGPNRYGPHTNYRPPRSRPQ